MKKWANDGFISSADVRKLGNSEESDPEMVSIGINATSSTSLDTKEEAGRDILLLNASSLNHHEPSGMNPCISFNISGKHV